VISALPRISAVVIIIIGAFMAIRALVSGGIITVRRARSGRTGLFFEIAGPARYLNIPLIAPQLVASTGTSQPTSQAPTSPHSGLFAAAQGESL